MELGADLVIDATVDIRDDVVIVIPPTPEGKRGGVMLAQEGGRWSVTLIGHFGEAAPLDLNGFVN
jgi:hypothetical protein